MRLLINASTLRGLGSALVGQNVLRELGRRGVDTEAWIPRAWGWSSDECGASVRLVDVPPGMASKFVVDNLRMPARMQPGRKLFSLTDTSAVVCPVPHLLLVHTAYLAVRTGELQFPMTWRFRGRLAAMQAYFRMGLRTVDLVTVQSEFMKEQMEERWALRGRVVVVPSATASPGPPEAGTTLAPSYLFCPSSPTPHKNHALLAEVVHLLAKRGVQLRCAVTIGTTDDLHLRTRARELGVLEAFDFLGPVSQAEVARRMQESIIVLPTRLESFGLPFHEALANGSTIVASDLPFAREACGDAAIYADPDRAESFADQIGRLVEDEALRSTVRGRARARSQALDLSWAKTVDAYLDLLRAL